MLAHNFRLLAVPWGGPIPQKNAPRGADLDGEWFSPRTDLGGIGLHSRVPVLWHHDRDPTGRVRGRQGWATNWIRGSRGWLADVTLDDDLPSVRLIRRLSDRVPIFGSTGVASGTAIRREPTGELLYWPLEELSLSPSPQNPFAIDLPPFRGPKR